MKHLQALLEDVERCDGLIIEASDVRLVADFSRQKVDEDVMARLEKTYADKKIGDKIGAMFSGEKINVTEGRAVLHTALRAPKGTVVNVDGVNIMTAIHDVREQVTDYSNKIRSGQIRGCTGKEFKSVLVIGIGGSALGTEFVYEAIRHNYPKDVDGRKLRILANVDPVDVTRAMEGLDVEETLMIVVSKTFTTAETMMNAKSVRGILQERMNGKDISNHLAAVSTNISATREFGVKDEAVFGFWDWVGGRFSVTSAVGLLPLSIVIGARVMDEFIDGAFAMDTHFKNSPLRKNIPALMACIANYNIEELGLTACAVLPYSQALCRFPAHVQQLCMESNGKRVTMCGKEISNTGEIFFGEPGTNSQHSFFQLLHQGREIPADFIGFKQSQTPLCRPELSVSNHDELMSNFFAQPDALALGKGPEQLESEGVPDELIPHKTFTGDRPSTILMFDALDAHGCGALLSLYENRTAVQGFLWGVNSFDQWGVELGKALANKIRGFLEGSGRAEVVHSTRRLLDLYQK